MLKNRIFFSDQQKILHSFILKFNDLRLVSSPLNEFLISIICKDKINHISEQCEDCQKIKARQMHDISYLGDYESPIKKEQIIDLITDSNYSALSRTNIKVYIIQGAEKITLHAQHALLNFLENIPKNVYIIFLTRFDSKIIRTIKSRLITFTIDEQNQDNNSFLLPNELEFINIILNNSNWEKLFLLADQFYYDSVAKLIESLHRIVIKLILVDTNYFPVAKIILINLYQLELNNALNRKIIIEKIIIDIYNTKLK